MNTNKAAESNQQNFNTETSFGKVCIDSCRKLLERLENVRANVVSEFRDKLEEHQHVLELAMNEAEALAWQTGVPELFFPTLATEKATAVAAWHRRQQILRRRSSSAPVLV